MKKSKNIHQWKNKSIENLTNFLQCEQNRKVKGCVV